MAVNRASFTSVISNRGFRFLWFNQILVQLALNSLNFALIIWVFKLVDSSFAVSVLMLAMYLPAVIFGIFAGVFVDISDRRKIIIIIDLLLAVSFAIFIFIKGSYPLILINLFFMNALSQFFMPSESSSIPMLVTKKQLFLANSLFSLTLYGSFMIGFSIAGPILNIFGINAVFMIGAVMMVIAFFLSQGLPSIKVSRPSLSPKTYLSFKTLTDLVTLTVTETKHTYRFIQGKLTVAVSIGLLTGVQVIIGILAVIMPAYLERILKIHATDSSYFVMLPLGLGMILGALFIGRQFQGVPRRYVVRPAIIGAGLLFIFSGTLPIIAQFIQAADLPEFVTRPRYFLKAPSVATFFALGAFLLGVCTVAIIIPCQTVLQESTRERNRGKLFAVLAVLMTAFSAVPVLLSGVISDVFGVAPLLGGVGVITLILGLIALKPQVFLPENKIPFRIREFLGLSHWKLK